MSSAPPSKVGAVVIGRNEGARLEKCLRSVLPVTSRVVYSDSASSDGSPELAEGLGVIAVRLKQDGKLNAARGRNAGFAELKARYPDCDAILFMDGDCILQPGFVDQALAFLREHPKAAVACGQRFEVHPDASIYNALCDQEWNTPVGRTDACGGDALMRREALDQVGAYDGALLAGEEPEMTARMRAAGWEIWRIDARMTEHDARMTKLSQWWKRCQRGGFGYAQVWTATKALPQRLYEKNLRSAFIWALAIPLFVIILALLSRQPLALLLIPAAYGIQVLRNLRHSRGTGKLKWANAFFVLLAKFPEAIGASRFFLTGGARTVPEYKAHG
jgi:GT2 family glycosyltransferase